MERDERAGRHGGAVVGGIVVGPGEQAHSAAVGCRRVALDLVAVDFEPDVRSRRALAVEHGEDPAAAFDGWIRELSQGMVAGDRIRACGQHHFGSVRGAIEGAREEVQSASAEIPGARGDGVRVDGDRVLPARRRLGEDRHPAAESLGDIVAQDVSGSRAADRDGLGAEAVGAACGDEDPAAVSGSRAHGRSVGHVAVERIFRESHGRNVGGARRVDEHRDSPAEGRGRPAGGVRGQGVAIDRDPAREAACRGVDVDPRPMAAGRVGKDRVRVDLGLPLRVGEVRACRQVDASAEGRGLVEADQVVRDRNRPKTLDT